MFILDFVDQLKFFLSRFFLCPRKACHIFCCKDCQLQVDISIPCGSELSKISVKKAQQYQLGQVMTTLAPYAAKDINAKESTRDLNGQLAQPNTISKIEGVGVLSVRVLNACLFDKAYASDTEPSDIFEKDSANLRHGDHYVRVSWLGSTNSKRTKTVLQAAKPVFDSDVMQFDVPHYGMEYKVNATIALRDLLFLMYSHPFAVRLKWSMPILIEQ